MLETDKCNAFYRNASLFLNFLVVLLITKSKAKIYEPSQILNQPNSFSESSTEDKLKTERMGEMAIDVSMHDKKVDLHTKPSKESSNYKGGQYIDYYEELINILGKQFEDVEVLSKQDEIETFDAKKDQVVQNNAPKNFSIKKSKVYAVHPYQPKHEKSPSFYGPVMYLINEDEDESSPLRYYEQIGRKSNPQYSYFPKKKDYLLKLFPGLASESYSDNQHMRTKKKLKHDMDKKVSFSKISLERLITGWPFGYDLNQMPTEYSMMHKVHLNHHPYLALMKKKAA